MVKQNLTNETKFIVEIKEVHTPYSTTLKFPKAKDPKGLIETLTRNNFRVEVRYNEDGSIYKCTCKRFVLKGELQEYTDQVFSDIKPYLN